MKVQLLLASVLISLSLVESQVQSRLSVMESPSEFWRSNAQNHLKSVLERKVKTTKAKNIILFIGDGMSMVNIAATRMYVGSEQTQLAMDEFPSTGFTKTYCVNAQTADSACTATAYLCGIKNKSGTIGVNANVDRQQCVVDEEDHVKSIAYWAQQASKSTGIVTTTRITHASPAGAYAHTSNRDWENDKSIPTSCREQGGNVDDIAYQLIHGETGKNFKVILGGGRNEFINSTELDDEGVAGLRSDGRNLIDEWQEARSKDGKAEYVWHNQQLKEIDFDKTDYLLGLFENDHCMYNLDIINNNLQYQEPSLTDMTAAAIKMLQKDDNGFFLFVEGGRIDHANHDSKARKALEETREFASAIALARQMTNEEETLIVVSSDHSHVISYSTAGQERGHDILGIAGITNGDGKPYTTINYGNGPGYYNSHIGLERVDISDQDFKNPNRLYASPVPLGSETHAADDVAVFASGPFAHLFEGSYEQNIIPIAMAYAAQIGPYNMAGEAEKDGAFLSSLSIFVALFSLLITLLF